MLEIRLVSKQALSPYLLQGHGVAGAEYTEAKFTAEINSSFFCSGH